MSRRSVCRRDDAIAVEVERISENQRYVTKILNERLQPALGEGPAEQVQSSAKERVDVGASERR